MMKVKYKINRGLLLHCPLKQSPGHFGDITIYHPTIFPVSTSAPLFQPTAALSVFTVLVYLHWLHMTPQHRFSMTACWNVRRSWPIHHAKGNVNCITGKCKLCSTRLNDFTSVITHCLHAARGVVGQYIILCVHSLRGLSVTSAGVECSVLMVKNKKCFPTARRAFEKLLQIQQHRCVSWGPLQKNNRHNSLTLWGHLLFTYYLGIAQSLLNPWTSESLSLSEIWQRH